MKPALQGGFGKLADTFGRRFGELCGLGDQARWFFRPMLMRVDLILFEFSNTTQGLHKSRFLVIAHAGVCLDIDISHDSAK